MSEGDEILFASLKQANLAISDEVKTVDDVDATFVISVCSQVLKLVHTANGTITPKINKLPESLPKNVAARHCPCSSLIFGPVISSMVFEQLLVTISCFLHVFF